MREFLMAPGNGTDLKDQVEEQFPKGLYLSLNPLRACCAGGMDRRRMTSFLQDSS